MKMNNVWKRMVLLDSLADSYVALQDFTISWWLSTAISIYQYIEAANWKKQQFISRRPWIKSESDNST